MNFHLKLFVRPIIVDQLFIPEIHDLMGKYIVISMYSGHVHNYT